MLFHPLLVPHVLLTHSRGAQFGGRLFSTVMHHSPFNVVAWHGGSAGGRMPSLPCVAVYARRCLALPASFVWGEQETTRRTSTTWAASTP